MYHEFNFNIASSYRGNNEINGNIAIIMKLTTSPKKLSRFPVKENIGRGSGTGILIPI